jgi:hypothetical protein
MSSEDTADQEDLVCAVVIYRVCRLMKVLKLCVFKSYKFSVNSIINPNLLFSTDMTVNIN